MTLKLGSSLIYFQFILNFFLFFQMMPNLVVKSDGSVVQKTHIARTHDKDQSYELVALPESETKMSLLGNLFLSNGKIFKNQFNTKFIYVWFM